MGETSIEWTDRSVNPIRATNLATGAVGHFCELASAGCKNCYARAWNLRVRPSPSGGPSLGTGIDYLPKHRDEVGFHFDDKKVQEVLRRRKPTKYFWCDMTDMFGEFVPDEFIALCFGAMAVARHHTHQVLTKRAARMRELLSSNEFWEMVNAYSFEFATGLIDPCERRTDDARALTPEGWPEKPLPNVWLGVSVEDQKRADERIPLLLGTPATVRFLSVEPLLGPVSLAPLASGSYRMLSRWYGTQGFDSTGSQPIREREEDLFPNVDWVIVGGESGTDARPCEVEWIRSIVRQCKKASAAVFVKQLGRNPIVPASRLRHWEWGGAINREARFAPTDPRDELMSPWRVRLRDTKGGDPAEWPEDLRVREFPEARS